jgi:uncharacterized protein (DUF1778 family)
MDRGRKRDRHLSHGINRLNPVQSRAPPEDAMMPRVSTRTARLEARVSPDVLAVLKRAAELQGRSVSDFVVAAAQEAAHRTVEDAQVIRLSVEDQRRFVEALLNPTPLTPAMERAIDRYRTLIAPSP